MRHEWGGRGWLRKWEFLWEMSGRGIVSFEKPHGRDSARGLWRMDSWNHYFHRAPGHAAKIWRWLGERCKDSRGAHGSNKQQRSRGRCGLILDAFYTHIACKLCIKSPILTSCIIWRIIHCALWFKQSVFLILKVLSLSPPTGDRWVTCSQFKRNLDTILELVWSIK